MSLLMKGGPLMIPILLCSIVAVAIIIERFVQIRKARRENDRFIEAIRGRIRKGNLNEAIRICEEFDVSPLSRISSITRNPLTEKGSEALPMSCCTMSLNVPSAASKWYPWDSFFLISLSSLFTSGSLLFRSGMMLLSFSKIVPFPA